MPDTIYVVARELQLSFDPVLQHYDAWLNKTQNQMWRSYLRLYKELEEWCSVHPPSSRKRKVTSKAVGATVVDDDDRRFNNVDNFVDPLGAAIRLD